MDTDLSHSLVDSLAKHLPEIKIDKNRFQKALTATPVQHSSRFAEAVTEGDPSQLIDETTECRYHHLYQHYFYHHHLQKRVLLPDYL